MSMMQIIKDCLETHRKKYEKKMNSTVDNDWYLGIIVVVNFTRFYRKQLNDKRKRFKKYFITCN